MHMLTKLIAIFVGKRVKIISRGTGCGPSVGVCKAVHQTGENFDLELEDGSRYGFTATTVTDDSIEGGNGLKERRIELFPFPKERQAIRDAVEEMRKGVEDQFVGSVLDSMIEQLEESRGDNITAEEVCRQLRTLAGEAAMLSRDIGQKVK